jgi:transcriptional regulator with XRE-family HTH domain
MNAPDATTIGQRLRAARLARGLTVSAVAQHADLTWQQVAALEGGRIRSRAPHLLRTLSYTLEVSVAWVLTGAEDAPGGP